MREWVKARGKMAVLRHGQAGWTRAQTLAEGKTDARGSGGARAGLVSFATDTLIRRSCGENGPEVHLGRYLAIHPFFLQDSRWPRSHSYPLERRSHAAYLYLASALGLSGPGRLSFWFAVYNSRAVV